MAYFVVLAPSRRGFGIAERTVGRADGLRKQSLAAGRQGPGRRPPGSLRLSLPALEAVSRRRRLAAFRLRDL